jgi:hypothetical protein
MSRWLPSFFCLIALLGPAAADATPRLTVAAPAFDFGSVERGTRVEHIFKVKNEGDSAATIRGVDRVCACTVGTADTRLLPPGKDVWVTVALDTTGLAGATAKAVMLRSDDPQTPALRLVIQGTVLADLVAEPPVLYLGEVRRGVDVERAANVRSGRPGGTSRVAAVAARGPFVAPSLVDDGAGGQRVVVRVADTAPSGRFHDEIVLRTADGATAMTLPVFGVVRAELHVEPAFVRLGAARRLDAAVLQVVNRGETPVTVRAVHGPRDVATYELETVRRGYEYAVHVELRRGRRPRALDDRIEIVTDHPTERSITVPLHVIAQHADRRYN